jgi:hypothetical protein
VRNWAIYIFVVLALAGGILRLALDPTKAPKVSPKAAVQLAGCFARTVFHANDGVTLTGLTQTQAAGIEEPATKLSFVAPEPLTFTALNPEDQKKLLGKADVTLPPKTIVRVQRGEFSLDKGSVAVEHGGGRFLLTTLDPIRFKNADSSSYDVTLSNAVVVAAPTDTKPRQLPQGAQGTLALAAGSDKVEPPQIALVALQPFAARPWILDALPNIEPTRVSGARGMSDLSVEARRPGMQFDASDLSVSGCAWAPATDASEVLIPAPVALTDLKPSGVGSAKIVLAMPSELVPAFSAWPLPKPISLAVVSNDGQYVGYGAYSIVDRGWAGLFALVVAGGLLWGALNLRSGDSPVRMRFRDWMAGLFVDADRKASLSLFQIFFWTVITVWGLIYVYFVTGSLLGLTPSVLTLLGISGVGTVAARFISPDPTKAAGATPTTNVDFSALLSTNGVFDLLKLQLFVFTLLIGTYVVWRICDTGAFPDIDANTLLLLGVSQGLYIGGKVASTTPLARAQALKLQLDNKTTELDNLKKEQAIAQEAVDKAAAAATQQQKDALDAAKKATDAAQTELSKLDADLKAAIKDMGLTA